MAIKVMAWAGFTFSESAAATLTTDSILTGTDPQTSRAMLIHQIEISLSSPEDSPAAGATETVAFSISRRPSLAAMPTPDDPDCIYRCDFNLRAGVATYLPLFGWFGPHQPVHRFEPPEVVVAQQLHLYLESTNSSAAASVWGRIGYNYGKISGAQVLAAFQALVS